MLKLLKRTLLVSGVCLLSGMSAKAQDVAIQREYLERPGFSLGMNIGLLDLWGDVGTQSILDHYYNEHYWKNPHFMGGIYLRYTFHPALSARLAANYGTLYATDQWNINNAREATSIEADAYQRYLRNQDIRANTWEGTLMLEFSPLRMNVNSKLAGKRFQPYILAGVGAMHFKPQTTYYNRTTGAKTWVNIADKSVEREGFPRAKAEVTELWQPVFPAGLGVKWDIGDNVGFGIEYLFRFTMTDRLDMVSAEYGNKGRYDWYLSQEQAEVTTAVYDKSFVIEPSVSHAAEEKRGNSAINDYYSTISVTFFYKLKNKKMPWWY